MNPEALTAQAQDADRYPPAPHPWWWRLLLTFAVWILLMLSCAHVALVLASEVVPMPAHRAAPSAAPASERAKDARAGQGSAIREVLQQVARERMQQDPSHVTIQ
jgi:hypothetical protein